jgi:transposase-like protein
MSGVSPFEDDFKIKILNEALKGERPVTDIAAEGGIAGQTLRTWLEEHYAEFPDDERRHLQLRKPSSQKPPPAAEDDDGADDDNQAREDMGSKNAPRDRLSPEQAEKIKPAVLEDLKAGELTLTEIGDKHNVNPSTVSYWRHQAGLPGARERPVDPRKKPVFADFKAGLSSIKIAKKHGVSQSALVAWKREWRQQIQARRDQMAHARTVKAEMLQTDPEFRARYSENLKKAGKKRRRDDDEGQLELPDPTSQTQISRPSAPAQSYPPPSARVAVGIVRYEQPPSAVPSDFITESFKEAVEERNTLRGMLKIVQRERDEFEKQLAAYQRRYGVMQ